MGISEDFLSAKEKHPACFYYENNFGFKFIIYSFVAETVISNSSWVPGVFRNYCRQRQLNDAHKLLIKRGVPAICFKNPELYILCKRDVSSMAVGLWNIFADEVLEPVIYLDEKYSKIDFYNCSGVLQGDKVLLNAPIDPYKFAFFTVYN